MKEEVIEIDVKDIKNFPNHPFKITNDLNYEELRNSIVENCKIMIVGVKYLFEKYCYKLAIILSNWYNVGEV